jgi:general secretion pathway protein D
MNHVSGGSAVCAPVLSQRRRLMRTLSTLTAVCALAIGLGSCANSDLDMYDPASGATRQDYKDLVGRRGQDKADATKAGEAPPIPAFQSVLAAPSAPELADTRRVSLAVTETTPVRDIIIELARKAEVDLELDPRISGGIVMSVTDRPFIDVIERVTELAELRYTFEKNVLKVELDDPYLEQYRMDVLNQSRTSTGTISSSTDASSAAQSIGASGTAGGSNKSETSVTSNSQNDFWTTIGQNIDGILQSIQSRRGAAGRDIGAKFTGELDKDDEGGGLFNGSSKPLAQPSARSPEQLVGAASALSQRQAEAAAALEGADGEKAESADGTGGLRAGKGGAAGGGAAVASNYSVNPQAGLITVFANKRQQKAIEKYLRTVRASVMQQVLIEAKILEITLNDQYRAGVNWQAFLGPNNDLGITTNFSRNVVPPDFANPTLGVTWANSDQDLSIAATLVKQFGSVRTLSSPRLTVTNNQTAMLKVAQNQIFFDIDVEREEATVQNQRERVTIDSEIRSVPVGLIINVQPSIDPVTKRITMGVRPSITRITGSVPDPAVAFVVAGLENASTNITSLIPIVEVRELDSMVSMDSGQTIVMGGLMQESSENTREGLPGAMDIPILGQAVSQNIRASKVTELVIFIRATVVNDSDTVADEDIRLYKTFTPDPRPIAF